MLTGNIVTTKGSWLLGHHCQTAPELTEQHPLKTPSPQAVQCPAKRSLLTVMWQHLCLQNTVRVSRKTVKTRTFIQPYPVIDHRQHQSIMGVISERKNGWLCTPHWMLA